MKYSDEFETENEKKNGGKGFYIALAVCLVAICGVAVTTFVNTLPKDEPSKENKTTASHNTTTTTSFVQQVVIPAPEVKDDRTTETTSTPTATTADTKEFFVFPVSNQVLHPFSATHAYSETLGSWVTHNGVDFAGKNGDVVKAAADGKITAIRQDALWGQVVEITHDAKVVTRYCGMTAKNIQEGQAVKAGDTIGVVSDIPAEVLDEPHLHMEVVANGKFVDPLTLIQGKAVIVTTSEKTTTTVSK